MFLQDIPKAFRKQRKFKKMTQGQLAEAVGLTRESISRFENGATEMSMRHIFKMSCVLGLEIVVRPGGGLPTVDDELSFFDEEE